MILTTLEIIIPRRKGGVLHADFYSNSEIDKSNSFILAILCHGFGGERGEGKRFPPLSERLLLEGFDSIQFDFSGSGANDREPITLLQEIQDLEDIVHWAQGNGYTKFNTIGFSLGALVTLLTDVPGRITSVFWSPAFYFDRSLKGMCDPFYGILNRYLHKSHSKLKLPYEIAKYKAIWVDYTFVDGFDQLNLDSTLFNFHTPSLIVQGTKDWVAKASWTREAFLKMPQDEHHQFIEMAKVGHLFHGAILEEFIDKTIEWIKNYSLPFQEIKY